MDYSLKNQNNKTSYHRLISDAWKPWRKAISVQRQVLSGLIYREVKTRFGEQSLGMFWAFGEVLSHIMVFWGMWTIVGRHGHNGFSTPIFLISGFLPYFLFRNAFQKTANCVSGNQALLVFSQIKILDFALARCVVEFMIYITAFVFFLAILYFFDFEIPLNSAPQILWGFIVIWLIGLGAGLIYLPFNNKYKIIDAFIDVAMRCMYFASGAIFPLERLPKDISWIAEYNPIFNVIEYLREGFIEGYGHYTDIFFAFEVAIVLLIIGLLFLQKFQKMILDD